MKNKIKLMSVTILVISVFLQPITIVKAVTLEKWENQSSSTSYASGTGTKENPYLIGNVTQLLKLKDDASSGQEIGKYYELSNDINLDGKLWTPIGTDADGFYKAHFDGKDHLIKNLTIDENKDNVGFVAVNNASTIQNISLGNIDIKGNNNVGGLIGKAIDHMIISNSLTQNNVSGKVKGINNVGGLIGNVKYEVSTSSQSPIGKCFANIDLQGQESVGGLIGNAQYIENIQESFAIGKVTGTKNVGGLIGYSQATKILAAYTRCEVIGTSGVSGFVGNAAMGTIEDAYSLSQVKSTDGEAFVQNRNPKATFDKCYYATDKTESTSLDQTIKGLKSSEMTAKQLNFNHPELWTMKDSTTANDFFPQLTQISMNHADDSNASVEETRKYKVEFNLNGGVQLDDTLLTQYVEYDDIAKAPRAYKKGYQLSWDKDLRVTGEVVITAVYTPIVITALDIIGSEILYLDQSLQYTVEFTPRDALESEIVWSIKEGHQYITLSEDGIGQAKKCGTAIIQAALKEKPEIKSEYTIEIKDIIVENIKKDIQTLETPLSVSKVKQVILLQHAFQQLTEKQKMQIEDSLQNQLRNAFSEAHILMRNKDNVQIKGDIGENREIFVKSLMKDKEQWSNISNNTKDYVSQVYESYLFDYIENKKTQPNGRVEITMKTNEDYTKQKGIKILMMKGDSFVEIIPNEVTSNTIVFETDYINDFGVVYQQEIKGTETSDSSQYLLYIGGFIIAGLGLTLFLKKKK